uniref:SERPIN domain-containing protein n=1 Tax=Caenorhabditis japonica TaxID=281687 RepID=A0A8R1DHX6_CAEJA
MTLQAETTFGLNLLKTLPANESLVFSPLAVALVLSLVHCEAKGKTREQIGNAILPGANDDEIKTYYQSILTDSKTGKHGEEVNLASKAYTFGDYKLKMTLAETLDVSNQVFQSIDKINEYVSSATKDKVKRLACILTVMHAKALLISAMSFNGVWAHGFSVNSTSTKSFHLADDNTKNVPFIHSPAAYRSYASDDLFDVAVLDYKDPDYRFAILLPKYGLGEALEKLDSERFQNLLSSAKRTYMSTMIPKFLLTKKLILTPKLRELGIKDIFEDTEDLLTFSNALHKSIVEVNEKGTATDDTYVPMNPDEPSQKEPIEFKANHPFLFALVHKNHPLLLGKFYGQSNFIY